MISTVLLATPGSSSTACVEAPGGHWTGGEGVVSVHVSSEQSVVETILGGRPTSVAGPIPKLASVIMTELLKTRHISKTD